MEPTPPEDSYIGKLIAGRYAVVEKLNEGGMGAVYLAIQRPLDRPVALKVLLRQHAEDPVSIKRFEKEARAVSRLTHPHVVTLYDFGHTEGSELYIAMEYLQGASLHELLHQTPWLPWDRALHIVRGITSALVAAHGANIVHRDLKPENVMLVERSGDADFVKVLDFGLARSFDADERKKTALTQRDVIPGTPAYLAPERANGVADDPRSDLYSLGALWFELLTGRPPFEAESSIKVILAHMHDPPQLPSQLNPAAQIPPAIDALVLSLLEKAPHHRPDSAAALLERLDQLVRPRGWHVAATGALAQHAATDDGLRGFADAAADLDELHFELEQPAEEPMLLTRRKTGPPAPAHNPSMMMGLGDMPAPEEPLLLEKKKQHQSVPSGAPVAVTAAPPEAVHLLEQQRSRIVDSTPPQMLRISSLADLSPHLARAHTVRDVAELCVAFLSTRFDRTFVMDMRAGGPQVLASLGIEDAGSIAGAVARCQSVGEMLRRKDAYYGPSIVSPDWLAFFRTFGGSLPGAVFVGALKREGEPLFFFYGDHKDLSLRPDVKDTVVLMREAAAALAAAAG